MITIEMKHEIDVHEEFEKVFSEADDETRLQLMAGSIIAELPTRKALQTLFASLGALCDERHLNKGKILFEWSEKFDRLEKEWF